MFEFEKILKENGISETDPNLPRGILRKIEKFRATQAKIVPGISPEEKDKLEDDLDTIDAEIMKTLPDYFDIEDEAEIKRKEEEKKKADKAAKDAAAAAAAEKKQNKTKSKQAVKKVIDDEKQKADQERIAKLQQPATSDYQALSNLWELGKRSVTTQELKAAGFNTGFWGSIGPTGCTKKEFTLFRRNPESNTFTLSKKE